MLSKKLKYFLFVLFLLNATFSDALLPDYEYSKNMPIYLKVYIDELAEQQIADGLHTEEIINEFRQQKENKYLPLLKKIKKNKNKPQINFEFDQKFPKTNQVMLLNLVAVLLEAGELEGEDVNDFMQKRQDRIVNYRKTKCRQYKKETRKKYYQNNKEYLKKIQKEYYQNNKEYLKKIQKEYYQRKKLLAQQGDQNAQQELLNKIQSLNDYKMQILIDASLEPNTERSFDIPTPKTPSVAQYLLDLYQNGKSSVSFDDAMEDAIYADDSECEYEIPQEHHEDDLEYQNEISQEVIEFNESIMFGKRKKSWLNDNQSKKIKLDD